jgi:hypothetical protein
MPASSPSHTFRPNSETPNSKEKSIGIWIGPSDYPSTSKTNKGTIPWVVLLLIRSRTCSGRDFGKTTNPIPSRRIVKISGTSPFRVRSIPQIAASSRQSASVLVPGPFGKGLREEILPLSAGSLRTVDITSGK